MGCETWRCLKEEESVGKLDTSCSLQMSSRRWTGGKPRSLWQWEHSLIQNKRTWMSASPVKWKHSSVQFSLVAQSCPALRDPMDCSTLGFPVHHQQSTLTLYRAVNREGCVHFTSQDFDHITGPAGVPSPLCSHPHAKAGPGPVSSSPLKFHTALVWLGRGASSPLRALREQMAICSSCPWCPPITCPTQTHTGMPSKCFSDKIKKRLLHSLLYDSSSPPGEFT